MSGIPAGAGSLLGKRLGKYDILALLALGGTAEIYLARTGGAGGFEKYVVVKCLHDHLADDPDFVKMFLDEARLAAMLDHSNIVQTFELGEYQNRYYMVMEFLAGLSLAMVVRRAAERLQTGLLPTPLVLNIAAQAAAGLHYAHERTANGKPLNMVHRDISPQNLVISFEGVVKVVDFGIARAELRETKTKAGTIKGKFAYMSPEQCIAANVDRRTDVFALGVIVHELLTGRRLFKRNSPYETYQAVIECAVEPPSKVNNHVDPAIDDIVMKAVAKDKDKRYPTAEAFGDALLGYLHHRGKASGGNELGRFFEAQFEQEIEEHGERMRELIAGQEFSVDTGMGWGEEDEKQNQTVDLGAKLEDSAISLLTGEIQELRASESSLDSFVGNLGGQDSQHDDDDEMPAERTRIEQNPLEKIEQLNQQVERNSVRGMAATGPAVGPGNMSPPTVSLGRPSQRTPVPPGSVTSGQAAALPAPPTAPRPVVGARNSFPELPNLNTAISGESQALGHGQQVHTPLAHQPTAGMPAQPMFDAMNAQGPNSSTQYAVRASAMQNTQPPQQGYPPQQHGQYPQHPQQPQHRQQPQQPQHPQHPYPMQQPLMNDYPVSPGGQRPYSTDLAPSNMSSMPQRSPYANAPFDPGAAANLLSPVGEQYPQTDWERAAAMQAKALPPWLLAALFVAALGGALLLTLVIAKIFS